MKILGTGLSGLVGSRIVDLLNQTFEFENISRSTGVDITNKQQVESLILSSDAEVVLHLAAKTDVDACEEDKKYETDGEAWKINVLGTDNIAQAAFKTNKKLIYISTDFVFDGEKEFYVEDDTPNPINWYARTKAEGENIVKMGENPWIILRIAYPYRQAFVRKDFFRVMLGRLQNNMPLAAVTDHIFCPTFIDDIAATISSLILQNQTGIFHCVGSEALSPYDAAIKITEIFNLDKKLITKTTRDKYFAGKAPRPFRLLLKNDKIEQLNIATKGFSEILTAIKNQP